MPSTERPVTAADIDAAAHRLDGIVTRTPLTEQRRLSALAGARVVLKREDLQSVRSYKVRGATNLIAQLDEDERARGVTCASAGNHAQGVAFACNRLGVRARIFLPRTTPRQKRDRVARIGGESVDVVVEGAGYDEASAAADRYAQQSGAVVVPAFDDARTVAGQGTVVREAVEQLGQVPDVVVVPVGGGGLLAGTVAWLREHSPGTELIGVEPAGAASMSAALSSGGPVTLPHIDPFVDGAAVRRVGELPYQVVHEAGVRMTVIPEGRVCQEMLALYQADGIVAEPAGALAPAAVADLLPAREQTVLVVLSGGNNDVLRYPEIVERALVYEGRKHYFLVDFPQEPGALRRFLDEVLGPEDDIALFEYVKRSNRETGPALVGIELGQPEDLPPLLQRMATSSIQVEQIPPDSPLFRFIL
ncbi:threonine ammonia-lyase IlvA [Ornithinicoccus halotolerans]|uniref:threonine ammonia-lyase IlvA n=1 Tax=Ornithinicoccus halotolerans TaxID=1748220 RepID=UPI0012961927|nr:threonine ammonia-lyase IlvA [Ornithinicoccus halotolerans]